MLNTDRNIKIKTIFVIKILRTKMVWGLCIVHMKNNTLITR